MLLMIAQVGRFGHGYDVARQRRLQLFERERERVGRSVATLLFRGQRPAKEST